MAPHWYKQLKCIYCIELIEISASYQTVSVWTRRRFNKCIFDLPAVGAVRTQCITHVLKTVIVSEIERKSCCLDASFLATDGATILHVLLRDSFRSLTNFMQTHTLVLVWWNVYRLTAHSACYYWARFGVDMLTFKMSVSVFYMTSVRTSWMILNVTEVPVVTISAASS